MKELKLKLVWVLILGLFFCNSLILFGQINISGFFDVQYKNQINEQKINRIELGQFELGLQKSLSDKINIEGAIAFNKETSNFELGSGYADFTISKSANAQVFNNNLFPDLGIMIGQFDVPFGIDYKCIASPDRKMVSPPIAVQYSVGCLNKLGLDFYGSATNYNFNIYIINGFTDQLALGGRIGILPFEELELSYSYLSDFAGLENIYPEVSGTALNYSSEKYEVKGELIWFRGLYEGELDTFGSNKLNKGFYLQLTHIFEGLFNLPFTTGIRYGNNNANNLIIDEVNINSISRLTALLGVKITDNTEVKTEFSASKYDTQRINNLLATQLVVKF